MFQVFTGHTGWLLGQTRISLTPILSSVIKLYTNISQTVHFGEPTENSLHPNNFHKFHSWVNMSRKCETAVFGRCR